MKKTGRIFAGPTVVIALAVCVTGMRVASAQEAAKQSGTRIEVLPVADLPLVISMPALERTADGYSLRCSAANYASEQVLGATFLMLVLDSENRIKGRASWTQRITMAAATTKDLSFQVPAKLRIRSGDHLMLAVEQVYGHDSIWQVANVRESVESYAKGDPSVIAKVRRVANQFDPRQLGLTIKY
jgi:hypothetical protein